jgi:hypothetical protein
VRTAPSSPRCSDSGSSAACSRLVRWNRKGTASEAGRARGARLLEEADPIEAQRGGTSRSKIDPGHRAAARGDCLSRPGRVRSRTPDLDDPGPHAGAITASYREANSGRTRLLRYPVQCTAPGVAMSTPVNRANAVGLSTSSDPRAWEIAAEGFELVANRLKFPAFDAARL